MLSISLDFGDPNSLMVEQNPQPGGISNGHFNLVENSLSLHIKHGLSLHPTPLSRIKLVLR